MLLTLRSLAWPPAVPRPFVPGMPLLLGLHSLMQRPPDGGASSLVPNPRRTLVTGRHSGAVTPDFDIIEPGETDVFTFDVTRELGQNDTINAISWDCLLAETLDGFASDVSPGDCIIGGANAGKMTNEFTGRTRWYVNQRVGDMVEGNYYYLRATMVIAPAGRTVRRYSRVLCMDELALP